jgi:hypothetical protein
VVSMQELVAADLSDQLDSIMRTVYRQRNLFARRQHLLRRRLCIPLLVLDDERDNCDLNDLVPGLPSCVNSRTTATRGTEGSWLMVILGKVWGVWAGMSKIYICSVSATQHYGFRAVGI